MSFQQRLQNNLIIKKKQELINRLNFFNDFEITVENSISNIMVNIVNTSYSLSLSIQGYEYEMVLLKNNKIVYEYDYDVFSKHSFNINEVIDELRRLYALIIVI